MFRHRPPYPHGITRRWESLSPDLNRRIVGRYPAGRLSAIRPVSGGTLDNLTPAPAASPARNCTRHCFLFPSTIFANGNIFLSFGNFYLDLFAIWQ